ncbi:hypothetical protein GBAR_LOCUS14550, partial [Geodia barretti]
MLQMRPPATYGIPPRYETEAKRKIQQLQGEYDDILALAKMEMAEVENLHYSTLCFVPNPKKEHQELVKK